MQQHHEESSSTDTMLRRDGRDGRDGHDPAEALSRIAHRFGRFAALDGQDDALYAALAGIIAADPALMAPLLEAPPTQHLAVLLLAALHDRILAGEPHPLAAYYASVGGHRAPDAELPALLKDFMRREDAALRALTRSRTTQTNETGRCAVLRPALQTLATRLGGTAQAPVPLALFDFGCSAGLNLGVDRYAYQDAVELLPGATPDAPLIRTQWRGERPAALLGVPAWRAPHRMGVDLQPVAPEDPVATRWLRACLWPGDAARRERLDRALADARRHPVPLLRTEDGLGELERWMGRLPEGVTPVIANVWVLAYFDREPLRAYVERLGRLVRERGLAWISGELGRFAPLDTLPPDPEGEPPDSATLWTLQWRDRDGALRTEPLAWSHAHGRWISWLASPARPSAR
ncbi:DUF2332 domain-containing protein [Roseateles chitosanitabidus]|uniref:DUF2332 domain-containing protein n=1 Tax=Roseateles chitosanitabidus TaxID=65048 RepID=UPI00082BD978|nr:DUF2332 domain-containing protein [Roseateles chitosanitabidus]